MRAATRGSNPLGNILINLGDARNRRRGQGRTVTLANEIADDLSYIKFNLNARDVENLTTKQFNQVTASFIK